jgi:hypothetical protein
LLEAVDGDRDGKATKDELVAGARKFFAECDKDRKGTLEEKVLADGLTRLLPRPPGFGPPGVGPGFPPRVGPVGPGGPPRSPGATLATVIIKRAGTDRNGQVTLDAFVAAAEALFRECDKDKNGSLDEKEIAAGIELLLPPPPGFGPPPGRPEESGKEANQP